jgi:uncharacterized membrane protein YfbV (UPF0208 family)
MGDWLVWGQNLDPNLHQDTLKLESSHQGFDWRDKNAVVPVYNQTKVFLEEIFLTLPKLR